MCGERTLEILCVPDTGISREERRRLKRMAPAGTVLMRESEVRKAYPQVTVQDPVTGKMCKQEFFVDDAETKKHHEALESARDILNASTVFAQSMREQAKNLYNLFKGEGLISDSLARCGTIALHRWPIRASKVCAGFYDEDFDRNINTPLSKSMWLEALYHVNSMHQPDYDDVAICQYDAMLDDLKGKEYDDLLCSMYLQTLIVLNILCTTKSAKAESKKFEQSAKSAQKRAEQNKTTVKLERLQAQLNAEKARSKEQAERFRTELDRIISENKSNELKLQRQLQEAADELELYRSIEKQEEQVDEILGDIAELMSLPESGLVFCGGHPNLVAKMRQIHRGWRFISSVSEVPEPLQADYVFCYAKHMSHKLQYKLKRWYSGTIMYCDGTNLDMLHNSMRRVLTAYASGGGLQEE